LLDNSLVATKLSRVIEVLASPRRREIVRLLWTRERSAGELHEQLGDVTFGAVSQHLRVLEDAGVVVGRREGRNRFYAVQRERLGPLAAWLEEMWSSALYRLKLEAELEQTRRGPRARRRRSPHKRRS
jgi:DNA-binding transcriptional ArsR family regulator